jgi:hypothetical protein
LINQPLSNQATKQNKHLNITKMTKPIPFLLFFFACIAILTLAFKRHQPVVPRTGNDTVKPQFQKFIRTNVSVQEYMYANRIKDSIINAYRQEMGDKTLRMYYEMEDYLRTRTVLDSVKVGGGK